MLEEAGLAAALGRLPRDERRHGDVDRADPCRRAHVCVGALAKPAKPARKAGALSDEGRHVINGSVRSRWVGTEPWDVVNLTDALGEVLRDFDKGLT